GAGPDVKGAEGGETENFCPASRKGQKFSVDRTLDRRDTGHAAAEGRWKNHIFPPAFTFFMANRAFLTSWKTPAAPRQPGFLTERDS
ncbi:MAG: hypothetical protein IJC43_08660, partial [Clostridia bacterium]|nr:hypothetical protein [Clostridia bacterium]